MRSSRSRPTLALSVIAALPATSLERAALPIVRYRGARIRVVRSLLRVGCESEPGAVEDCASSHAGVWSEAWWPLANRKSSSAHLNARPARRLVPAHRRVARIGKGRTR
jgi:hypothetical protein